MGIWRLEWKNSQQARVPGRVGERGTGGEVGRGGRGPEGRSQPPVGRRDGSLYNKLSPCPALHPHFSFPKQPLLLKWGYLILSVSRGCGEISVKRRSGCFGNFQVPSTRKENVNHYGIGIPCHNFRLVEKIVGNTICFECESFSFSILHP